MNVTHAQISTGEQAVQPSSNVDKSDAKSSLWPFVMATDSGSQETAAKTSAQVEPQPEQFVEQTPNRIPVFLGMVLTLSGLAAVIITRKSRVLRDGWLRKLGGAPLNNLRHSQNCCVIDQVLLYIFLRHLFVSHFFRAHCCKCTAGSVCKTASTNY